MSTINTLTVVGVIVLVVVCILLVWFTMTMASSEAAIARITRSMLNNLILEVQTNDESAFARQKHLASIHRVQKLVINRYATAASCSFARIVANVVTGVLIAVIAYLLHAPLWAVIVAGIVCAFMIALTINAMRPRSSNLDALDVMVHNSRTVSVIVAFTPFTRRHNSSIDFAKQRESLSDDEELERIHLEQGRATIERLTEGNDFDPEISEMLRNVLTLSETLTREIMVPRTDMVAVNKDETLSEMLKLCSRSGFSRIPVIGSDADDLVGVAYLKDAVRAVAFNASASERSVESIVRDPMLVPESKPVDDLFHEMQIKRQHVAVVVDEYGGISGLVTIEDTIEQIVGELEDEHDRSQHTDPIELDKDKWKVPARTSIADIEELFEVDLDEDDVDTVYGLLTKALGRVPLVDSSAVTRGLRLTAVDSAGRRKKVSMIVVERDIHNDSASDTSSENTHEQKENNVK